MGRPRWATRVLAEIHRLVASRLVRFTFKASEELGELALDEEDALQILAELSGADLVGRLKSVRTPEWLYIFKPEVGGSVLYVKLIVRAECLVVSFHEDEGDDDD
jgi:Motility quorum-sensing regulator, toxin of MqsA